MDSRLLSTAGLTWCGDLSRTVQQMTRVATAIADTRPSQPPLHTRIPLMQMLSAQMMNAIKVVSDSCMQEENEADYNTLQEGTVLINNFAELLTTLVPQLDMLGALLSSATACSIGSAREEVFWEMWRFMNLGFAAISMVEVKSKLEWLLDYPETHDFLFSAFNRVLIWILSMARSPAWRSMKLAHGLQTRNYQLVFMLRQMVACVRTLTRTCKDISTLHTLLLPPNLLPTLCSILSEQFFGVLPPCLEHEHLVESSHAATTYADGVNSNLNTTVPFNREFYHLLTVLTWAVNNVATDDSSAFISGPWWFLTNPAVSQLWKVLLVLPAKQLSAQPDLVRDSLACLTKLTALRIECNVLCFGDCLLISERQTCLDAAGLPSLFQPHLSRQEQELDARLMHALSMQIQGSTSSETVNACYGLQDVLVQSLQCDLLSSAAVSVMIGSVVGLAKQCMLHGLRLMQDMQQQRLMCPPLKQPKKSYRKLAMRRKLQLASTTKPSGVQPYSDDWTRMEEPRYLLLDVSEFLQDSYAKDFHRALGE